MIHNIYPAHLKMHVASISVDFIVESALLDFHILQRSQSFLADIYEIYHTAHFFLGFILEPTGQLKSRENSSMFDNGPRTRNSPGLWNPVVIRSFIASGRYLLHQLLAALIQNICSGL